jgi:maltose alpha-D-glucosyltransferase/alpha-amylase
MLKALSERIRVETSDGSIVFEASVGAEETLRRPETSRVLWLTAEQSNSSLIVDDAVVLKIFRRIASGIHPEAEVSRHLTINGFANTPALLGEVYRISSTGERNSLAVAQVFIRNQGDAWSWTLDQFNRALEDLSTRDNGAEQRIDKLVDYTAVAAAIGKRLGEMHTVLATPTDDPAFSPEVATENDIGEWLARAISLLDKAFTLLRKRSLPSQDDRLEANMQSLLSQHQTLVSMLRDSVQAGLGSPKIRVHGDFHLGQVLVASGDVYIIDFEGEPGQSLEFRRTKSSPLRDVAGFIRSLDYAAAAALDPKNFTAARLLGEDREALLTQLRDGAQKAFLDAYRAAAGTAPDRTLLDFFLIEKAAYELGYEAANRPAWLSIPVNGLCRLAERILGAPSRSP